LTNSSYYGAYVLFPLHFVNPRSELLIMSSRLSSSGAAEHTDRDERRNPQPASTPKSKQTEIMEIGKPSSSRSSGGGSRNFRALTSEEQEDVVLTATHYNVDDHTQHNGVPKNQASVFAEVFDTRGVNAHKLFERDMKAASPGELVLVWTHEFDNWSHGDPKPHWQLGLLMTPADGFYAVKVGVGRPARNDEPGQPFKCTVNFLKVHLSRCFFAASDPTPTTNDVRETYGGEIFGLSPPTTASHRPTKMYLSYVRDVPKGASNDYETALTVGSHVVLCSAGPPRVHFVVLGVLINNTTINGPSVLLVAADHKAHVSKGAKVQIDFTFHILMCFQVCVGIVSR
jgi:hypothetical protein